MAAALAEAEAAVIEELNQVQGVAVELGGYYRPDEAMVAAAMRPSERFNRILAAI